MRTLSSLSPGECGTIKKIMPDCSIFRRLQDLGLVPGTEVACILKSPFGDPVAYSVRGALIAIRQEDTSNIILR